MFKINEEKFLTTGEVVGLLSPWMSRSTVSRRFDKGELAGMKNPITGKRMISYKSVRSFAMKYGIHLVTIDSMD